MKKGIFFSTIVLFLVSFTSFAKADVNINSFLKDNYIIVYGSQIKESVSSENNIAFELRKALKSSYLVTSDKNVNSDLLKNKNLIVLSNSSSNSLFNFGLRSSVKTDIPIKIQDNTFAFGDKVYSNKDFSIVFVYPSSYNPEKYTLTYYSGSLNGLRQITKIVHANNKNLDYKIIKNNTGKVVREGNFKKDKFTWSYDSQLDKNYDNTKVLLTSNLKIYYNANSSFVNSINSIAQNYENNYKDLLQVTNTSTTDKIAIFLYDSEKEKNINFPNGNINYLAKEIHVSYNKNTNLSKYFASLLFNDVLKFSKDKLIEKSFIIFAQNMKSNSLDKEFLKIENLNKTKNLIKFAINNPNSSDSQIILASFTKHIINKYGFENYKKIINQINKVNEFEHFYIQFGSTDMSFDSMQNDWIYETEKNN